MQYNIEPMKAQMKARIEQADAAIQEAERLIGVMEAAGVPTADQRGQIIRLQQDVARWRAALATL